MRRLFICFALLGAVPVLWPSDVAAQKKNPVPTVEEATDQDYAALLKMKEIAGILLALDPDSKTLTLQYQYPTYEPIPPKQGQVNNLNRQQQQVMRQYQQLMNDYQRAMQSRNPRQQQQSMQRVMADMNRLQTQMQRLGMSQAANFKTVTHQKDFDFDVSPVLKVARVKLPLEYDDKGAVKEYTKAELKKMRDPDMPGYTAKIEDLQAGQTVKLYLGRPKAKKKSTKEDDEAKKGEDEPKKVEEPKKEEDKKIGDEIKSFTKQTPKDGEKSAKSDRERPFVRMILIVADPDPSFNQKKARKKKANAVAQ